LFQSHNLSHLILTSGSCSEDHFPVRKNSENASLLSVDSTDSNTTRSPPAMPVPTVPRRAGPPRKKPAKPTPPPEVPEVPEEREMVIATPAIVSLVDELEQKAVETAEETAIAVFEHEVLPDHKEIDNRLKIHDEPQSINSDVYHESAKELVAESEPAGSGESKDQVFTHDVQSPLLATIEVLDKLKQEHEHKHEHTGIDYPSQPEAVVAVCQDQLEDDGSHYEDEDEHSQICDENYVDKHHEHLHLQQDNDHHVGAHAEPQPSSAAVVACAEAKDKDEDAAEEEARRKRVAERLAKMGGVNPFAAPLLSPPLRRSSEEVGNAPSPVISSPSYALPPCVALPVSPPRPDIPTRKASLRSPHEVAEPLPVPVVESKVKEERGAAKHSDGE